MSQDDLSSRENQRPPGRRSRAPWIIGLNIAAGVTAAAVFTGISLSTQHAPIIASSPRPVANSGTPVGAPRGPWHMAEIAGVKFSYAGASLDKCSAEGTIHSTSRGPQVFFSFENNTSGALHLSWLNHQGDSVSYGTIPPGKMSGMNTAVGDVWKIANASSVCLVILTIHGRGHISVY